MLFVIANYITDDPTLAVVVGVAFLISLLMGLSFHEFCHALVGDRLGDGTPRWQGRLTLNPAAHLDPMGTLMLLFAPIGWAKPVQVNPMRLRFGPKLGMALVAVAGPISNFLLAAAFSAPLSTGAIELRSTGALDFWSLENYVGFLFFWIVLINISLGVFNLLPLPPLDGSRVAMLLPGEVGDFFRRMEAQGWGLGILFLLLALPFLTQGQVNIIGAVLDPIRSYFLDLFLG